MCQQQVDLIFSVKGLSSDETRGRTFSPRLATPRGRPGLPHSRSERRPGLRASPAGGGGAPPGGRCFSACSAPRTAGAAPPHSALPSRAVRAGVPARTRATPGTPGAPHGKPRRAAGGPHPSQMTATQAQGVTLACTVGHGECGLHPPRHCGHWTPHDPDTTRGRTAVVTAARLCHEGGPWHGPQRLLTGLPVGLLGTYMCCLGQNGR